MSETHVEASLEAAASIPAGEGKDLFGRIEDRGIDIIPDAERTAKPSSLFAVFFGPQFGLGNMLFGALPIAFGLGWWASFGAITVGVLLGSLIFLAISPLSPLTGTNTQVSSGIAFGVRGRLLGSAITWFIAIGFFMILIYTSGEAIAHTFHRWWGTPDGNGALSLGMLVALVLTCGAAILGHATLEKSVRIINVIGILTIIALFVVFAPKFSVIHGGSYLLGGFWPTWFLATMTTASLPISWGPFVGDYGRYVPATTPRRVVSGYAVGGIFLGCWVALLAAAFAATSFPSQAGAFATGIIDASPAWFLLPLLIVPGVASNVASAAMSLYNAALDIGAWPLFFRFPRWRVTAVFSGVLFGLTYVFVILNDFLSSLEAFVTVMAVTATPWMVIIGVEFLLCRGKVSPADLHAFAVPGARGRYWYRGGVNLNAFAAWAVAVVVGLMFSATSLYTGPLVGAVKGVDISWLIASLVAGGLYTVLRAWVPSRTSDATPAVVAMPLPEIITDAASQEFS